jgi:caspase domain-containing protein
MRWLYSLAIGLMLFSSMVADANAEKRVALVIGNGAYKNVPTLPNPPNDAADVAAALRRSGFDIIFETNLDQIGMQDASIRFAREARTADVALFYYSGHALQFAGVNYLVPVDATLRDEADLRRMARADEILADLQQAKNLRILVLDACRDNPFAEDLKRSIGRTRSASIGSGLAKMESPDGTIISYATQSGRTADDGFGRNSPYTRAFLKHIQDKDTITTVFQHVSASVYEDSKGSQVPELSLSFFGEFYLNGKPENTAAPPSVAVPVDPCAGAPDHWRSAEAVGTVNAFEDHMLRFPTCAFTGLAKSRIAALSMPGAAVSPRNTFDGIWIIKEICDKKAPWPADSFQFGGRIKDGIFHFQYGEQGKPGSGIYEGEIEADGTSEILVNGFIGNAANDPLHRVPGTEFHYKMVIKLEGSRGAGVRSETPRPCRSEWSMLSPTVASTPNANSDSPKKSTADRESPGSEKTKLRKDANPAEIKHPKAEPRTTRDDAVAAIAPDRREPETSRNRQTTNGLSCTKMMGRCGAVCAANSGRPDCASTICVRLQQQCLNTGCWNGRAFSSCGLIKQ